MSFIEVLLIAVGLAMDAFAVSFGVATHREFIDRRAIFRLSFHFGLFQFFMPIIGWFLGINIAPFIAAIDHWIAFFLLFFIGAKMIYSSFQTKEETMQSNPSRGWSLVALSVATSIDALAVGLSLAVLDINIWYPSVIIGVVTASLSLIGIHLGTRLSEKFGSALEVLGGLILIFIGARILVTHLFFNSHSI